MEEDDSFTKVVCQKFISIKEVICKKSFVISLALGQSLSVLICGTAITSGLLERASVNIPTGQTLFHYILLAIVFSIWNSCRVGFAGLKTLAKERLLKYFLIGILEVEANFFIVKAYQYTSVTSVQLLDCLAIPTVLILSKKCLKAQFGWQNYVGVVICLLGAGLLILADFLTGRYGETKHSDMMMNNLLGDLLCIIGAILYGILNVCQEYMVTKHGSIEYLSSAGTFAGIISIIQFAILERQELPKIDFTLFEVWFPLLMFVICMFSFYCLMSYTLTKISAMIVNLNLLSSDFFSLIIGLFVFQYKFHALYFGSFIIIIAGVLLYNLRPAKSELSGGLVLLPSSPSAAGPPEQENASYGSMTSLNGSGAREGQTMSKATDVVISTHL